MQESFQLQLREEGAELIPLPTLAYAINMESAEVNRRSEIIGNYLIQAKAQLPEDSSFMAWVREQCPFSHSTALALMKYARGVSETPALAGKPKSIVLEVMKLPANERADFIAENDGKSVRETRRLIEEKEEAQRQAELAKTAYQQAQQRADRAQTSMELLNNLLHDEKQRSAALQEQLEAASQAEAIPVEVEVPPADYDYLKQGMAEAQEAVTLARQEAEAMRRKAEETEAYAMEQEAMRKQAQSELRKARDASYQTSANAFSASGLSETFSNFLTSVGTLPHMGAFFKTLPSEDVQTIRQWVGVVSEWAENAKEALDGSALHVDADTSVV